MGRHNHPEVSLHNHPLHLYMEYIYKNNWKGVADLMLSSARKLKSAGADFLICPDNTIHEALDLVLPESPLPWLHIAEEVASAAETRHYKKLALLGTKYLMEGPVYPGKLRARNLKLQIPDPDERLRINDIIFDELVNGKFLSESQSYLSAVIGRLKSEGCDAAILGCTEIPLIINDSNSPLPVLDSTRLLARAALARAVGP
jgi:aspartate racemase